MLGTHGVPDTLGLLGAWLLGIPLNPPQLELSQAGIAYLTRDWAEMARRSHAALDQDGFVRGILDLLALERVCDCTV